jgi:hypothetical protein
MAHVTVELPPSQGEAGGAVIHRDWYGRPALALDYSAVTS